MAKKDLEITIDEVEKKENKPEAEVVKADEAATEEAAVELAADEPEQEEPAKVSADSAMEKLKKQLEDERRARFEAEKRAQLAQQQAHKATNEVDETNLQLITNAIDAVKSDTALLKQQYRDAMATGDYDKVAELQEAISLNAAKMLQLENGKSALQNKPRTPEPQRTGSSDPVEQFASQLSPRSADWIRRNPQCVTDPRLTQKMIAAHNLAIADGYQADSDDYFGFIEETLRINRPKAEESESPMSAASAPTQRRAAPAAAPVSRSGNGTGTRPNVVRLSEDEREMAKMMGMTDQDYAKNKIALIKEGKLPH
jgi:hypothetical protein